MDALNDARALAAALFDSQRRLYALDLDGKSAPLAVERWRSSERLSGDRCLTLDCLSDNAHLDLDALPGKPLRLRTRGPDGREWPQSALLREVQLLGANGGLARYRLVASSWWWCLGQGRRSRVFQDASVLDILETVFNGHRAIAAWAFDESLTSALAGRKARSYCVQYRESDQAFCARLLAEEGLGFVVEDDDESPAGHRLRIFADSTRLVHNDVSARSRGGIRFHRADATEAEDSVQRFESGIGLGATRVTRLSDDYRAARASHASLPVGDALDSVQLDDYDVPGAYAFADATEAETLARRHAEALEARKDSWRGLGSVRGFQAGTWFTLAGAPEATGNEGATWLLTHVVHVGVNNLPNAVVAATQQHLAPSSVLDAAAMRADAGIEAMLHRHLLARAEASGYANTFDVLPRDRPWRDVLLDGTGARLNPRPTAPGPQSARVVGPDGALEARDGHEVHCDALGRVRLRMHWQSDVANCWVRVAQRYAGPGVGSQFLPRIGQEVLVDFLDGDIDRPVVIGALYNGRGEGGVAPTPGGKNAATSDDDLFAAAHDHEPSAQGNLAGGHAPAWHGASPDPEGHRNAAALSGFRSKAFGGGGHNQLVFDDSDGQGRVQLATTHAATQLNLGHLIHQADNHRGSFRGEGFELRTDDWGAVRAEAGLLVSTGGRSGAAAGDNVPGTALLRQMVSMAEGFSDATRTHGTVGLASHLGAAAAERTATDDANSPAAALLRSARTQVPATHFDEALLAAPEKSAGVGSDGAPHSGDAQLSLVSRAGLGLLAGQSLQLHCGDVLQLASGQDSQASVVGDLRLHAGQAIGWLAGASGQGEGLHLIAGRGALDLQAQDDTLALRARDDVQVASANAELEASAGKRIHLAVEGGASITIENGNLTIACPGQITVHAAQHSFEGPTTLNLPLPLFPRSSCKSCLLDAMSRGAPGVLVQ